MRSEAPEEPPQIWLQPIGGVPHRLTGVDGGAGHPSWSPKGDRIAFLQSPRFEGGSTAPIVLTRLGYREDGVGLRPTTGDDLFVVDVASGMTTRLVDGASFVAPIAGMSSAPVWSPDGSQIAYSWSEGPGDLPYTLTVYVVDVAGGDPVRVGDPSGFLMVADWGIDGNLLLWGQERFKGAAYHSHAYVMPSEGGQLRQLAPDLDRGVEPGPCFAPRGDVAVCSVNDRGSVHIYSMPVSGAEPTLIFGGERTAWGLSVARDRLATVVLDESTSGEIETWRTDGSDRRRLTDLFADSLPDARPIAAQKRSWRSSDGTVVQGWILRPDPGADVGGPTPLLLSVHGGPHLAWGPAFYEMHLHLQVIAAAGWTVLLPNPRGSAGYGERFMSEGAWGDRDVDDLLAGVDALIEEGIVDGDRVAVTGYSYGGYMACLITALHDRFRAAVAGGTATDGPSSLWSAEDGLTGVVEFGSDPWNDPERWKQISAISHVRGVRCPTLILHGAADETCPFSQAEAWFLALRLQGVPVELVRYPGASHSFQWAGRPSHRIDYGRRLLAWLQRYANGGAFPPADARA